MELNEDDYTLCDCCGSYAQSTADDDGEGNPLGHVQCEQCSRIAELESKLEAEAKRADACEQMYRDGWRACIDHIIKPSHVCPVCMSIELRSRLDAALADLRQCYKDDGCTAQEIEDQLSRFAVEKQAPIESLIFSNCVFHSTGCVDPACKGCGASSLSE